MRQRFIKLILAASLLQMPALGPVWAGEEVDEKPRACINVRAIKRTRIVDDVNVLFVMRNNSIYHNILPRRCQGLHRESRFSYKLSGSNLCRHDSIRVHHAATNNYDNVRLCRLGVFHPVARADDKQVIEWLDSPRKAKLPPPAVPEMIIEEDEDKPKGEQPQN